MPPIPMPENVKMQEAAFGSVPFAIPLGLLIIAAFVRLIALCLRRKDKQSGLSIGKWTISAEQPKEEGGDNDISLAEGESALDTLAMVPSVVGDLDMAKEIAKGIEKDREKRFGAKEEAAKVKESAKQKSAKDEVKKSAKKEEAEDRVKESAKKEATKDRVREAAVKEAAKDKVKKSAKKETTRDKVRESVQKKDSWKVDKEYKKKLSPTAVPATKKAEAEKAKQSQTQILKEQKTKESQKGRSVRRRKTAEYKAENVKFIDSKLRKKGKQEASMHKGIQK